MNLNEFYDALENHDWFWMFSDDLKVKKNGENAEYELNEIAKLSSDHQDLLNAFRAYHFSGEPWKTERCPKPNRPVVFVETTRKLWGCEL